MIEVNFGGVGGVRSAIDPKDVVLIFEHNRDPSSSDDKTDHTQHIEAVARGFFLGVFLFHVKIFTLAKIYFLKLREHRI
jgi:hypothetical protein